MAISNHTRVGKALELLRAGLAPYVSREMGNQYQSQAHSQAIIFIGEDRLLAKKELVEWDVAALLKLMWEGWNSVFRVILGPAERSLVSELRSYRNKWAHQESFSGDDTYRALDSVIRLLTAISASESDEVEKMRHDLLRIRYDEQVRNEKRKACNGPIVTQSSGSLKPWREVITPHKDVITGRFQQAEFAADLWQVFLGEGSEEYLDPKEFFKRTYLTESLKHLLVDAVRRLSSGNGSPVVQLQTNFGGGKTHCMLALYHLASGISAGELVGMEELLTEHGLSGLRKAKCVVLVGNKISPGNPVVKSDGTVVKTLWRELAWQLGGREAYDKIRADDERATNPGDKLRELMNTYGPCLILIDEWVAYARQLHDNGDLPGGSFETQFTFAQALTESAKLATHALLVVSLPASESVFSGSLEIDNIEVGGLRGREALERIKNVIGRLESSWRPATAEEGFEIVRRRLFEPLSQNSYRDRDVTARTFSEHYREHEEEFPIECKSREYEQRIKDAYPVHPEIFDRLYQDWSVLVKFQRTRGVLRLMAAVIHSLWSSGDKNPLILPANIPIDDQVVQSELTRYLPDNWAPIIEQEVDSPNSLPTKLDGEVPNLGKYSAFRRIARAIYLGSAPNPGSTRRGIEDRRIKLSCSMPEESPTVFGDALRRLFNSARYLHCDGPRYWYDTKPTVTKLAEDRAEQIRRECSKVKAELLKRLHSNVQQRGNFSKIHIMPASSADVSDESEVGLVILSPLQAYLKSDTSEAVKSALSFVKERGSAPRHYRNSLIFLAADSARVSELEEALSKYLAWESVVEEKEQLNLDPHQVKQAERQRDISNGTVESRILETYQWLLVPEQNAPNVDLSIKCLRLNGKEPLATQASKKLIHEEYLFISFAGIRLRMVMDTVPLWRGAHVQVKQLLEDFWRYPYLPRLNNKDILLSSIDDGLATTNLESEGFAFAEQYDEEKQSYCGVRYCQRIPHERLQYGFLMKPIVALEIIKEAEKQLKKNNEYNELEKSLQEPLDGGRNGIHVDSTPTIAVPKRYHATVKLNPQRVGRDAGSIAEEVISHLIGLEDSNIVVTLEIDAEADHGFSEHIIRAVTENGRTLGFQNQGFE